jgi:hypothetical protein
MRISTAVKLIVIGAGGFAALASAAGLHPRPKPPNPGSIEIITGDFTMKGDTPVEITAEPEKTHLCQMANLWADSTDQAEDRECDEQNRIQRAIGSPPLRCHVSDLAIGNNTLPAGNLIVSTGRTLDHNWQVTCRRTPRKGHGL